MSDSIQWSDVNKLTVEGRGFDDVENFYDRLPARAQGSVPDPVWNPVSYTHLRAHET